MENSFKNWPYFEQDAIDSVCDVLRSGKINRWTGSLNTQFESKICESVNCKYAIAVANGSLALELAFRAIGIKANDEVIVPCRTFVASASAAAVLGAKISVVDIDINTQNILPEAAENAVNENTKAIVAVHLAGMPCDMDKICAIAKKHNLYVIEDCAQAHGAIYKGKPVGSMGDIAAFSYCQDKIITTGGEGGAVTTNNENLWRKMWEYKDHGKSYGEVFSPAQKKGFRWLAESFGTNFRMTEMQAALGIYGYKNLENWVKIRNQNASIYNSVLSKFDCIRLENIPENTRHAKYKHYCFVEPSRLKNGWSRDRIIDEISKSGIPCHSGACPNISAEKCFVKKGWNKGESELKNAYKLGQTSLMFLVHPTIKQCDLYQATKVIENVLKSAQK